MRHENANTEDDAYTNMRTVVVIEHVKIHKRRSQIIKFEEDIHDVY
jgi:hypothetical protein